MSLRRNQLKKMTMEQIMGHLQIETNPDQIKLIHAFIADKNETLLAKRTALLQQIASVRNKVSKNIHALNGRVKDRIDKKQTVLLNKDSRPNNEQVALLMDLYSYMENQGKIIDRNHSNIQQLANQTKAKCVALEQKMTERLTYEALDSQYSKLHEQCQKQEAVRDTLIRERDEKRSHYLTINQSIQQARCQYEIVENQIRDKERQLVALTTYYESRQQQDLRTILPEETLSFEEKLLAGQDKLNRCERVLQDRLVRDRQVKDYYS